MKNNTVKPLHCNGSKIEKLIAEMCPEGVEVRELGNFASIETGKQLNKTELSEIGDYAVLNGGINPSGFYHEYNTDENTIAISQGGASAGYVNFVTTKFWAGAHCFVIKPINNEVENKYLYFLLKNGQEKLQNAKLGAGIPGLNKKELQTYKIPIPPLAIQQEIVKILDIFTTLEAELEAELEARKKQYEYYRDDLLTFGEDVEWKKLQEIFVTKNGYTPSTANKAYWTDGTVPWFRMEDIRVNGRILGESLKHITKEAVKGGRLFPANSIIVATSATIGEHALITVPHLSNQRFTSLALKQEYETRLDMKFAFYYCFVLDEWCRKNITTSSFASVDMNGFKRFPIPIPPLAEQERIVAILNKFDTLVNDISVGLPAEINARRKQYEYYRNKLLTFKKFPSSGKKFNSPPLEGCQSETDGVVR
jgi:type I restriction enzyme S subunit